MKKIISPKNLNQLLPNILCLIAFVPALALSLAVQPVQAMSANLVRNGSFEGDNDRDWQIWNESQGARTFDFFRSYEVQPDNGTYAAGLEASGQPVDHWLAGLSTKNKFTVDGAKNYYLIFSAKSGGSAQIHFYLQDSATYAALTEVESRTIGRDWQKYSILLDPARGADALLAFSFGDLPAGTILQLDAIALFAADLELRTTEIRGYLGEKNKFLDLTNSGYFKISDISISLPYLDGATGQITSKKFPPQSVNSDSITFDLPAQTFSGLGQVYVNDQPVGRFNYNLLPKITDIYPSVIRSGEDVTIVGNGFNPQTQIEKMFIIFSVLNSQGQRVDSWIVPHNYDSRLAQITAVAPAGLVAGSLRVQTSFRDLSDKDITNSSNSLGYKVKPVVSSWQWARRGYDQPGDNLAIFGRGIINGPKVVFYDETGEKIGESRAAVKAVGNPEAIEAPTPKTANKFKFVVIVNDIESDPGQVGDYVLAKPRISEVAAGHYRSAALDNGRVPAAKIGEEITIRGAGFVSAAGQSKVEFSGQNGPIQVPLDLDRIDREGQWLKVSVPRGALSGQLIVLVNNERSNAWSLDIIPTVVSFSPAPVRPGERLQISALGVGNNLNAATLIFKITNDIVVEIKPLRISLTGDSAVLEALAPASLTNKSSSFNLRYGVWSDDQTYNLSVAPVITQAMIDLDEHILVIKGHGFSPNANDNQITYKYADANRTVIQPRVRMIGVFNAEDGQEIRVQILDNYYYGYVSVATNGQSSNEANFGPVQVRRMVRRVEYVKSLDRVAGVLYISGYNFGTGGGVKVGSHWADIHFRTEFFIIAVVDPAYINDAPVVVARQ